MDSYKDALKRYLEGSPQSILADAIGKKQATVSRYVTGDRFPDAETARSIHDKTEGAVPFELWQSEFMQRVGIAA